MAKFTCKCGNLLSNSLVPNDIELHVYSDFEWDDILRNDVIDPIQLPRTKYDVWNCPVCSRVYVFLQMVKCLNNTRLKKIDGWESLKGLGHRCLQ